MSVLVIRGDARHLPLPDACVDLIVTSPPYFGLRSYTDGGVHYEGQVGSEASPGEYVAALVGCTREWVRVLKPCGSLFVNLGDKYAQDDERSRNGLGARSTGLASGAVISSETIKLGRKDNGGVQRKSLLGLPWRYALNVIDQLGLILRAEIIWAKPNGLPESVTDRVRRAHEQVFHFTLLPRYYSAVDEIREPQAEAWRSTGRSENRGTKWTATNGSFGLSGVTPRAYNPLGKLPGSVWNIPSHPLTVPPALGVDHFAAFPMELPRRIILGWSPPGVCTACGEGRRPVAAVEYVDAGGAGEYERRRDGILALGHAATNAGPQAMRLGRANRSTTITGYACACPQPHAPTRPAIILDPFGGTGTTALLAHAHGRTGITIDHSADYSRLAAWRTSDPAELARALEVPKPPPVPEGMDALF